MSNYFNNFRIYLRPIFLKVWAFGFTSGLSLLLSSKTLNFYLAELKIDIITVGLFTLVGLPYALKFLVAPMVDRLNIFIISKYLGRPKAWLLVSQSLLIINLIIMANINPLTQINWCAGCGLLIALGATIQDITLDAARIKLIDNKNQGPASAMYIFGYRLGMLSSGAGVIYLSSLISWNVIYYLMASLIFLIMILLLVSQLPKSSIVKKSSANLTINKQLEELFIVPFRNYFTLSQLLLILVFIILYRLSDNLILAMINPFLLRIGYTTTQIATAANFIGIAGSIIGSMFSGLILPKLAIKRALYLFGLIHLVSHLLWLIQASIDKNIYFLFVLIGIETITGGMSMAAYITFISYLCRGHYIGTQYSLFSTMMGISRVTFPAFSGYIVSNLGYLNFFIIAIICGLPALLMIYSLKLPDKIN